MSKWWRVSYYYVEAMVGKFDFKIQINRNCKWTKLIKFMEILKYQFEIKPLAKAWQLCGGITKWYVNWPHVMQLWQKVLVVPSSVAICQRGFSKQKNINSHLQASLKMDTLDVLMQMLLCNKVGEYRLETKRKKYL